MKDNALRIILFVYCVSYSIAAVDITLAEPLGIELAGPNGQPIGPQINKILDKMAIHDTTIRMVEAASYLGVGFSIENAVKSLELGMELTIELIKMLFGVYAFEILVVFGVDRIWVDLIITVYVILVARAVIGYMPAIASMIQALASVGRLVRP